MSEDEWRCAQEECGALCVMTTGTTAMLKWCADSWDYLSHGKLKHTHTCSSSLRTECYNMVMAPQVLLRSSTHTLVKQVLLRSSTHTLVKALDQSSLTMSSVRAMRQP